MNSRKKARKLAAKPNFKKTCWGDQGEIGLREKFIHILKARGDKRGETRFFCQREISLCPWRAWRWTEAGHWSGLVSESFQHFKVHREWGWASSLLSGLWVTHLPQVSPSHSREHQYVLFSQLFFLVLFPSLRDVHFRRSRLSHLLEWISVAVSFIILWWNQYFTLWTDSIFYFFREFWIQPLFSCSFFKGKQRKKPSFFTCNFPVLLKNASSPGAFASGKIPVSDSHAFSFKSKTCEWVRPSVKDVSADSGPLALPLLNVVIGTSSPDGPGVEWSSGWKGWDVFSSLAASSSSGRENKRISFFAFFHFVSAK